MAGELRKLAAIMAVDVVGYSRLVGLDEAGTIARVHALFREVAKPSVQRAGGRVFKVMGDGFLAEFSSAVAAASVAVLIQEEVERRGQAEEGDRRIRVRIGLHLGDVLIEGADLLGDGVNIAARLEATAAPGRVVMSAAVADAVRGRIPYALQDLGEQRLKNIERLIRVFQLAPQPPEPERRTDVHVPPDRPSLVVLPFENMSGDPEQDYFADGVVEDITTALSRFRWLFVIARNSAFTYKGRSVDVRQIGRELGVRYVLEGSVRKAGGRIRITGQLVEAETGMHLWAERFDGPLNDVFDLQDRVTEAVARAVGPSLRDAEMGRARRKPTHSLTAYEFYLRALPHHYAMTREGNLEAVRLLRAALEADPGFAAAAGLAALSLGYRVAQGWADKETVHEEMLGLARRAADNGASDPEALAMAARILAYAGHQHDEASELAERATTLNPNSALVLNECGWVHTYAGHAAQAITRFEAAIRIDPLDPMAYSAQAALAIALIQLGRFEEAVLAARRSVQRNPNLTSGWRPLAAASALSGRQMEAEKAARRLLELEPRFRIAHLDAYTPQALCAYAEGLRRAGLPE